MGSVEYRNPTLRSASRLASVAAAVAAAACASPGLPPGGPADSDPPRLVAVVPESGSLNVQPREIVFRFDEAVSEQSLDRIVVVSPSDGPPRVHWRRTSVAVRPRRAWHANTAYTVTILPGLTDLRGNRVTRALQTSFSTGSVIPRNEIRGVAFDWGSRTPARGARVEATMGGDTTLQYVAAVDSVGRFRLGSLPAGALRLRAWLDQNNNGLHEPREPWDSVSVTVADSARVELYLFPHDSIGPAIADVRVEDSLTLRLRFDRGLDPESPMADSQITVLATRDSAPVRIAGLYLAATWDSLRLAREDSAQRADTSASARARRAAADSVQRRRTADSIAQAQLAALRARPDTVRLEPPPRPGRPAPPTEFVVRLAEPLGVGVPMRVVVRGVRGLSGAVRESSRTFSRPRPVAPRDSAGAAPRRPQPSEGRPRR
jgi:hypothetical protein